MIKIKSYFYKTRQLNKLKYDEIYNYALKTKDYRNLISNYFYENITILRNMRFNKISKSKLITKLNSIKFDIAGTTKQQQVKVVYDKYKIVLDNLFNNLPFNNSNNNSKLYSHMLRYYYNDEQYVKYLKSKKDIFYKNLLSTYELMANDKFKNFIIQSQYQLIIDRIDLITFNKLTYRDINVPRNHENMIQKSKNITLTNAIIKLNIPKLDEYILPVRWNKRYHGSLNYKYNLNKTTNQKQYNIEIDFDEINKEIKINLVNDKKETKALDFYTTDIIGVDVNVRDNLFTTSDNLIIDFDRQLVKQIADSKIKLDDIKSQRAKLGLDKIYSKRMLKIQDSINKRVKYHQDYMCSKLLKQYGGKHLVLENLEYNLKENNKEFTEFNLNCNDLYTLLKLYSIKNTVIRLAPKYNIEISLVNPDYTSQMCSECWSIDKTNRNRDKFKCKCCNHESNADYNASINIKNRITENVFLNTLSKNNGSNTYLPKYDNRHKFKIELGKVINQVIK